MSRVNDLTCEEIFERLNDYIDRELSPDEMDKVSAHLEQCIACAEHVACEASALDQVRTALKRIRLPLDVKTSIAAAIDKECGSGE